MSVVPLLDVLRMRGIAIWTEGDELRCHAPAGTVDPELREELRRRKGEILKFINAAQTLAEQPAAIVPLQPAGSRPPIFAVPGHSGDVFCFRALARHLGDDQPFFGLQPPGLDGQRPALTSVEALAADFAKQIVAFRPVGPYVIAGYCAGGIIAFELARQLRDNGAEIDFVAMFGSPYPVWYRFLPQLRVHLAEQAARFAKHARAIAALPLSALQAYIREKRQQRLLSNEAARLAAADPRWERRSVVEQRTLAAIRRYVPRHFAGRLIVFLPNREWQKPGNPLLRWPGKVALRIDEYCGPASCDGYSMLLEPHAAAFAESFRRMGSGQTA